MVNGSSAGINDLRYGYVLDDDWAGFNLDSCLRDHRHDAPLLAGANHYVISATVIADRPRPQPGWYARRRRPVSLTSRAGSQRPRAISRGPTYARRPLAIGARHADGVLRRDTTALRAGVHGQRDPWAAGSIAEDLGLLLASQGLRDDAVSSYEQAAASYERSGAARQ